MEIFVLISKPRKGTFHREAIVACFQTRESAQDEIGKREGEWRKEGWSDEDIPYYFIEKHELRS